MTIAKSNRRQLLMMACLVMTIQACSIPKATLKEPETKLPKTYATGDSDRANTANIEWQNYFSDPKLLALIELAIANNKEVNIMLQRVRTAENEILARKGEYMPFVNLRAGAEIDKVGEYTRNGAVEEQLPIIEDEENPEFLNLFEIGVVATWEIDIWRKLGKASQAALFEYMASDEGRKLLVTTLVAEVAQTYYELVALDNHQWNLEENIQLQEKGLEVVKKLVKFGRANAVAQKRYEAELNKNRGKLYEFKQQVVEVENRLNFLLGRLPQPIVRTSSGFTKLTPKVVNEGVPSQLLKNRPDIRKAELELSAADLNIDVARANFYPSLAIKANYGFEAIDTGYLFLSPESAALSLAGEISAPLLNRRAIMAQYKNADAKQVQAAYEYEQVVINAFSEVSSMISNIANLEKQVQLKSSQVEALDESIDLVNQLFTAARADYAEVLMTQRDALEAKMELIELKQKQINSGVVLYRALGGGWLSSAANDDEESP